MASSLRSCPGRILLLASLLALQGCAGAGLESFPPMVRPGLPVYDERARPWLDDAVREYVDARGLPLERGELVGGRLTTGWFPVEELDPALARCPEVEEAAGQPPEARHRARYRFTLSPRAGHTLLQVEAHWQREVPDPELAEGEGWVDCPSTGEWERATQERILLRARLMGPGGQGPGG